MLPKQIERLDRQLGHPFYYVLQEQRRWPCGADDAEAVKSCAAPATCADEVIRISNLGWVVCWYADIQIVVENSFERLNLCHSHCGDERNV